MKIIVKLTKLPKTHDKKYNVKFIKGGKYYNISFGANGYMDYIQYNQEIGKRSADEKKNAYITRHVVNEDWRDITRAGTWSRFILWNEPTLEASIADMEKRFNLRIVLN